PAERLRFMLADSAPAALLTQGHLQGLFKELGASLTVIDISEASGWREQLESDPDCAVVGLTPEHPAYVIYTSGSTGTPKGVMGLHRATVNRFMWMYAKYPFEPGEECCAKSSFSFLDSIWELFGPLLKGIPNVLLPTALNHDLMELMQTLTRHYVTRLVLVPSLLRAILEVHDSNHLPLPELKYLSTSGEFLPGALATEFLKRARNGRLLNLYGSSEDAADATYYEV